jgi:hypothetical protein
MTMWIKQKDFIFVGVPFPGTIITGATLQWWKQYSLALPWRKLQKIDRHEHTSREDEWE